MSVYSSPSEPKSLRPETATTPSPAKQVKLDRDLAKAWLNWQCEMVSGVICGAIFPPQDIKPTSTYALWPEHNVGIAQLVATATQAQKKNNGIKFSKIAYGPNRQRLGDVVACPVYKDGRMIAIISMLFSVRSEPQQLAVMQLLRWGGLWFETLLDQQKPDAQAQQQLALRLVSGVAEQPDFLSACIEAVNKLSLSFHCERVSFGLQRGLNIELQAISGIAHLEQNTPLSTHIKASMAEAIDQTRSISYPCLMVGEKSADAHAALHRQNNNLPILSVPMLRSGQCFGALCFEFKHPGPTEPSSTQQCESITQLIYPALEHKLDLQRSVYTHLKASSRRQLHHWFGPNCLRARVWTAAACFALALSANIHITYTVKSPANISGEVQQRVVAPLQGYVLDSSLRAGDPVQKDQVLATLESRTLQLELQRLQSQERQLRQKYHTALAAQDRVQISKIRAEQDQIKAEKALTEQSLSRTSIRSPFDGVLISGDLSQSLGKPVELGQTLFEIAPLKNYRVLLQTPERDIGSVSVGQRGRLVISAFPGQSFDFHVSQVVPLAATNESGNYFQVEAKLAQATELLRPGMSGHAKVDVGDRSILWILSHRLIDNLRILAWTLGL